jgi:hypothetical protein
MSSSTISRKAKTCDEIGMLPSVSNVTEVLCFPFRSRNVNVGRVSDMSSMQHIVAHVRSMDHSVVMPFAKHFPERTKQVEKVEENFM